MDNKIVNVASEETQYNDAKIVVFSKDMLTAEFKQMCKNLRVACAEQAKEVLAPYADQLVRHVIDWVIASWQA